MSILILTVGANPLPVVVSVLHWKPERVFLLASAEVFKLAERIKGVLARRGQKEVEVCQLPASELPRLSIPDIPWKDADLDYTGGQKLLSAQVYAWWRNKNPEGRASYLTDRGRFVVDHGTRATVESLVKPSVILTLAEQLDLHFPKKPTIKRAEDWQREWAGKIAACVKGADFGSYLALLPPLNIKSDMVMLKVPQDEKCSEIKRSRAGCWTRKT